jgi:hypothetical protein
MKYIPQELQTLEEIPPAYENNVEDPYPVPSYEQVKTDL